MEEFLELSNRVSWHNGALGACFQLVLDEDTIHCDLPMCDFPLIELNSLVLYLKRFRFRSGRSKGKFLVSSSSPLWNKPCLPSSPHARNPHIPHQRLRTPAQPNVPPSSPKLLPSPQPRTAGRSKVKPASRSSLKPAPMAPRALCSAMAPRIA